MTDLYGMRAIRCTFGDRTVLDIERLDLRSGAIYTLTGPNGAGKSTLLQILAFLLPPTGGELHFRGRPVSWSSWSLSRLRREVTLLHQSPYLFDGSVYANIAFGLKARRIRGDDLHQRAARSLAAVGLDGFGGRKGRDLSGGEVQRVAMARALALRPAVLLLDEPLANVDKESASILEGVIRLLPEDGTTVIMTTHDPQHTARLGGETLHLEGGRLCGAPPLRPAVGC